MAQAIDWKQPKRPFLAFIRTPPTVISLCHLPAAAIHGQENDKLVEWGCARSQRRANSTDPVLQRKNRKQHRIKAKSSMFFSVQCKHWFRPQRADNTQASSDDSHPSPCYTERATLCLQVQSVRIRTRSASMRIPLSPHHRERVRQFREVLICENYYWQCLCVSLGKCSTKYFAHLAQGINVPYSNACHSLSCNSAQHHILSLHRLYMLGVYWLVNTLKQAWQIPSVLRAMSHQLASSHAFLRQCTYVTEIPLQLIQALRQAFLYVLNEALDAKIPFCFLK